MKIIWGVRTSLAFALTVAMSAGAQGLKPVSASAMQRVQGLAAQRAVQATDQLRTLRAPLHLTSNDDFVVERTTTDKFGQTHVRVQQTFRGVPVWGGAAVMHYSDAGRALPLTDSLVRGISVDTRPSLTTEQALAAAKQRIAPKGTWSVAPRTELMVYPIEKDVLPTGKVPTKVNAKEVRHQVVGYELAYHVHTELENAQDGVKQQDFLIDAQSGKIIKQWSSLETAAAVGTGNSQFSGTVSLSTNDLGNGTFELRDLTRGPNPHPLTGDVGITIRDMANGTSGFGAVVTDTDNTWGDGANYVLANGSTSANGQTAAVDAAYGLAETWDYYWNYHNRRGIDDANTAAVGRVHAAVRYENAYWSDSCFCMTFGDGNINDGLYEFTAIDVVGHELSHGVTSRTAGLIYSGESGGLNEANSDIHGTMVEFYARSGGNIDASPAPAGANWLIGEQISSNPNFPLRYMYKPSKDGLSPDAWYPGIGNLDVHYSSGPMNRAFYFLSQGASSDSTSDFFSSYLPGGMTGIGNSEAADIWYRALNYYLLPWSDYVGARVAALNSAKDLFGSLSPEYAAVENAFAAINVGYSAGTFDDLYPPTVSASGTESGTAVTLTADATDNVGVVAVDFYVDGFYLTTVQSAPFTVNLHSYDLTNGPHQVLAFATDAAKNYGYAFATFTVANGYDTTLRNGNFENGDDGSWGFTESVVSSSFILTDGTYSHQGSGYAWFGDWGQASTDTLFQTVAVPAGGQTLLDFWVQPLSNATDGLQHGTFTVTVDDGSGAVQVGSTIDNLTGSAYSEYKVDLGAYAGKTITLTFIGTEDGASDANGNALATGFTLDDVSLRSFPVADQDPPAIEASEIGLTGPLSLNAEVSDQSLITTVEFWVDGSLVATRSVAPWTTSIPASTLTNGSHVLIVKATDSIGNQGASSPVAFVVDNTFQQLVTNPGFEDGTNDPNTGQFIPVAWQESSDNPFGIVPIANDSVTPHTGAAYAWLGGWDIGSPVTDAVWQTVTVPTSPQSAVLKFYFGSFTSETDGTVHDTFHFQVRDAAGTTVIAEPITKSNLDSDNYWHQLSVDLSAYGGQQITLYFEGDSDASAATSFILDDFQFNVSQADPPPSVSVSESGTGGAILLYGTDGDDGTVATVTLAIDGNVVATLSNPTSRFAVGYDSTLLADGVHSLVATATDNSGLVTSSEPVSFSTSNWMAGDHTAPLISSSFTENCARAAFTVTASDDFQMEEVELYIDGQFLGSVNGSPAVFTAPYGAFGPGVHTIVSNAIDGRGHHATSTLTFTEQDVVIDPLYSLVLAGSTQTFSGSSCSMSEASVGWSVVEAGGGTISEVGQYVAPLAQGTYHVVAASIVDGTDQNTATVRVYQPDLDTDGTTDGVDMGSLAAAYGSQTGDANYSAAADLDGNGRVDDADINLFLPQFGK